jgi:hypothetical protein
MAEHAPVSLPMPRDPVDPGASRRAFVRVVAAGVGVTIVAPVVARVGTAARGEPSAWSFDPAFDRAIDRSHGRVSERASDLTADDPGSTAWLPLLGGPSAARRLGAGTLRVWGFAVYDATLWVAPGFRADRWARSAFALSLRYRRDFRGEDIARRSLDEMQRMQPIDAVVASRWLAAMERAFPDVRAGDRLTGVWLPSSPVTDSVPGAQAQGRTVFHSPRGAVAVDDEPDFGPRFFALWMSPRGPKPELRAALLGEASTS